MSNREIPPESRFGQLVRSERARVPLAVIGVLVLLSSVMLVGQVETGDEPDPDVDASLTLDQTAASMQTVVRDSAQRAARLAAREPVTDPADTPWGTVLERSGPQFSSDPFENYLRALIYLEIRDTVGHASQTDGNIETTVQLPPVTTPTALANAISRVSIDSEGTEVTITLSNVTVTATRAGERIESRETSITATIVTPVVAMHDRVSAYEYAIDEAGVTEPGFSQRFNARTYAIGWARGWAQNYRAPIAEVLANRHIGPSANAALYRTQQDIFGAADPDLKNAVRLGWACMALKDGQSMFEEYSAKQGSDDGRSGNRSVGSVSDVAGRLCDSGQTRYERASRRTALPNILGGESPLRETKTVDIGELAATPLAELTDSSSGYSFENAIQRIFTIEGSVETEITVIDEFELDVDCGRDYRRESVSRDGSYRITETNRTTSDDRAQYYQYTAEVTVAVSAKRVCQKRTGNSTVERRDRDSYTISVTTRVGESETSPAAKIDVVNPQNTVAQPYKYTPGPAEWRERSFNNYHGASDAVTGKLLGGTDTESYREWLDDRLAATHFEYGTPDDGQFETSAAVELDYEELLGEFKLFGVLTDDIRRLQKRAANVSVDIERRELVSGNPTSLLLERLRTEFKEAYIDRPNGATYENVGQKVVYEARYLYYQALVEQLEGIEAAHETATAELDKRLTASADTFTNATRFLTQGLQQQEPVPETFPASNVTDDITYEVSGSPTYLHPGQTVDSEQVPAVDQGVEFAPLVTRNQNAIEMPYDTVIDEILTAVVQAIPGMSATPDAEISFRMAGDVLSAGELALTAHENAQTAGRHDAYLTDPAEFGDDIEAFAENVDEALDTFEREVARETVTALYPSPAADCIAYAERPGHDNYPGRETCSSVDDDLKSVVTAAVSAAEDGVSRSLAPYSTAEAARLVGDGNATRYIVGNITSALAADKYRAYDAFDQRYEADQWATLVTAAVRPAIMAASATSIEIGSVTQAESLDRRIQNALGKAATALVEERLANGGEATGRTVGEHWLGTTRGTVNRAARVPAGLPLLPIPGQWVATANAWTVHVAGEYARFEVSAQTGTPADGTGVTYVRENRTVSREIGGQERRLGAVEPVTFDSRTVLVVVTPPGVGVGDRSGENPECSPTYPDVGAVDPNQGANCTAVDP